MKTRKIRVLIVACIMFCLISALAISTNAEKLEIRDGTTSIENRAFYNRTDITSIVIPDSVTSIGDEAFNYCASLSDIVIGSGVTNIGKGALSNCPFLTNIKIADDNKYYSIDSHGVLFNKDKTVLIKYPNGSSATEYTIPDGVTSIGEGAFEGCYLVNITIPDSVTSIGEGAFGACKSLQSITIPDSVTSIGKRAFDECISLTDVTIGNSVTSIGEETFAMCDSLTNIKISEDNKYYSLDSHGVLFNKDKTVLVQYPIGNGATEYTIPNGVTSIGEGAFEGCYLVNITIPDSVTSIGKGAFGHCGVLSDIVIGSSVTSIGDGAFSICPNLTIKLADDNKYYSIDSHGVLFNKDKTVLVQYPIGNGATEYTIPNGVTSIGDEAFSYCASLSNITIPNSVTSIGSKAFSYCVSLSDIVIGNGVTSIGEGAFHCCYCITSIVIPDGVTTISDYTFSGCETLTSVTIPNSVTSIGEGAFSGCSLANITIPDSVTSIESKAFYNCYLGSIVIPGSVTSIGNEVFDDMYGHNALNAITVCGFSGTTAESYAKANDFPFVDISIAIPTSAKVLINGKEVSFTAYNIGGNNYFKLRDVAMAINGTEKNFDVVWNKELNSIELIPNQAYTAVGGELVVDSLAAPTKPVVTNSTVYIYGFPEGITPFNTAFNIKNNNFFKLRDIGMAFDFGIGWDNATKTITIDTSASYTE